MLRLFANRKKCLDLATKSRVCRVNLQTFYDPLPAAIVAEADAAQKELEQQNVRAGDYPAYATDEAEEVEGPTLPLIIQWQHSRSSRYENFLMALREKSIAVETNFVNIEDAHSRGDLEEALDHRRTCG